MKTITLQLTIEQANMLDDILCDAKGYHEKELEEYVAMSSYEIHQEPYEKEEQYHSQAYQLCEELMGQLSKLVKEETD